MALIIALSAPLLIAVTGLSVDIGYWYQQRATLQSAVDAAALAAARDNADAHYVVTDAATAEPYAVAAANDASNSQFNFTNSTVTVTYVPGTANKGTTISSWTATATIPRSGFFSPVQGLGLSGLAPGFQSASATADVKVVTNTSGGSCLLALGSAGQSVIGNLGTEGTSVVTANGCNITADSNGCSGQNSAITAVGNSIIETTNTTGPSIFTAGCTYTAGVGQILAAGGTSANNYNISTNAAIAPDPLYYMGDVPSSSVWINAAIPACVQTTTSGSGNNASVSVSSPIVNGVSITYCLYDSTNKNYIIPTQGTVTFSSGATYFFNNTLSVKSGTNFVFGSGIYYFGGSSNGGLILNGSGNITTATTGSTFVFADTSSYSLGGNGSALNLYAPTTNCVQPAYYNSPADSQNNETLSLYSLATMENGQGICGVLIYEARNNPISGTINGGATSTINGIIYTPKAGFTSTGNSSVSSTLGGTLGIISDNFIVKGTGSLNVSIGAGSSDLAASLIKSTTTTITTALLVQ